MKFNTRKPVPPKIRTFIDGVIATPLENIEEPLKGFVWNFEKGDFHHWVDLFNCFDKFFEKYIKSRKDLLLEDDFLEHDPRFPKEAVLHILRVIRIILDKCTYTHFYSVFEHHLSSMLASTDADVVEACLQTCAAFLKKSIGKHAMRDASLRSKLFAFAQGWGGKEEGLGLVACALENVSNPVTQELGSTLYFEFYVDNKSSKGLHIIHLPQVNTYQISDHELMQQLVNEYKVPANFRFALLTRLCFARAFGSFAARKKYTCIRLLAFMVFVQACGDADELGAFFNTDPGFINELVNLLTYEDTVHEEVRILCLVSLVALCQDKLRQPTVLSTVTAGAHRGILSSLTQKAIDAVASKSSNLSVVYPEALISLITVLASSSSGCSAMRESGFIPILLPLLKDTDPQHLHLVTSAVHVLGAFMDDSSRAATLFQDLGGLNDTIHRLKVEVSRVENGTSVNTDNMQPLYSDALVTRNRRSLIKALLRAISLGTYVPRNTSHLYVSEESLLPYCLCAIFKKATAFGGGVFSLASTVMSNHIHKEPTCFSILEAAGIPSAFLAALNDGVPCSSDAITCIPQCLDALCLNNNGLQAVKDHNSLQCLVKIFTMRDYVHVLTSDALNSLSSGLDELLRHASSLHGHGVDVLIEILNTIEKLGSGPKFASAPMETDAEDKNFVDTSLLNVESCLPFFVNHAACLLDNILKSSDSCCVFIEKKGVDAVLKLFTLPLMPLSVSVGQSIAVAFTKFSPNHSGSLARSLCHFIKEHLKSTNMLLVSLGGRQVSKVEDDKRSKMMRFLSSLEGILSLLISITKRNPNLVSELGASDGELFSDLGVTFKELLWQQSMCCDLKIDKKQSADVERTESGDVVDDITIPGLRIPVAVRNSLHSRSALERELLSIVQCSEVSSQRTRQALAGIRVGRTRSHLEPLDINSDFLIYNTESTSSKNLKKKTPEILVMEILNKLASTLHSFFSTLVKGFTSPSHQRAETTSISAGSKGIGTALAKVFIQALSFSGDTTNADHDTKLTLKCRYLGKVVDHMGGVLFDNRRRTCYTVMINNFYVQGTFKKLLNTFEATSQLLWTLPHSGFKSCLLNTLDSYCNVLEFFVNSSFLLPPAFTSHSHLVIQPVAVGLSIGLFPVPKDPKEFVRMLQSQVLDVILPVWNHALFPGCNPGFITKIVTLLNHIYSGVSDAKCGSGGATIRGFGAAPLPDEATIATIVEMGFTRRRAEEALSRVERNSVEMAMEWLFSHTEDHLQEEDDEMAEALALSLGSSSETPKSDNTETSGDSQAGLGETKTPAIDDILATMMKLVQSSDSIAFLFRDLFLTLCNRDKGEVRQKVISYLIRQMKLYPLETSKEVTVLCTISHTLALLLTEDVNTREIAAEKGIVSVAIDILTDFNSRNRSREEQPVPKCISALLLILVSLTQLSPKLISESISGIASSEDAEKNLTKIYEKSTGYLTIEEGKLVIAIVTDMIKHHVPSLVMQAVLSLCARLTKSPSLALNFLENGGVPALFSLPRTCFFISYDRVTSAIIRHLIEDPQTLQTAMELEIRQTLSPSQYNGHILPRVFLTSIAPLISRDPEIFMKAALTVCQVETLGGKTYVSLLKEREKEKDKLKVPGVEIGVSKGQKKIPASVTGIIHHMIEILLKIPLLNSETCTKSANAMEVDEPATSKGKTKVDENRGKESENLLERSTETAKTTFVLKLLSDILLMSTPAVGIVLKRDLDMCQFRGSNGVVHHILRQLLHPPVDIESDVPRITLSENASRFLVVLCGRSSEGRRRVISEVVKVLCSFSESANNSSKGSVLPDKKVFAFVDLVDSIFSKSSSSSNLVGSADITKAMIDGGMIPCLSTILRVLDLDHPEAPKVVNIILKVLEGLTRAANASELRSLSDLSKEKISVTDDKTGETNQNGQHEVIGTDTSQQLPEQTSVGEGDDNSNLNHTAVHEMRVNMEDMDNSVVLHNSEHIEMNFHVDDRGGNNTGDEDDDDMGDDEEDDVDGDDEDEDIAEDGPALMSSADTDGEDHDAYNDDMVDDFHENRAIEMRWREAHLLGQPRGDSQPMDMIGGPFQEVSIHDYSGVRRLALERHIQHHRTSESGTEGNGLRHPLLSRPSQSQSQSQSSDIRPSGGNSDVARYNMFDAQVLPVDHVRSSGVAPASLGVFPVGLESTYAPERRGIGDSQWDDGQPQEASQAAVIARTVEDHFMSRLHSNTPDTPLPDNNQLDGNPQPNEGDHGDIDRNTTHLELNQMAEGVMNLEQAHYGVADEQTGEDLQSHGPILDTVNASSNSQDNMEIGEGSGSVNDQEVRHDRLSATDNETSNLDLVNEGDNVPNLGDYHAPVVESTDVDMNVADTEANENGDPLPFMEVESSSEQNAQDGQDDSQIAQSEETGPTILAPNANGIDPTFLEALPEDLRAEVLASQQAQSTRVANVPSDVAEDIDPEFLAALPPDIQADVLAQQRAQRIARQAEGQPVDMDNASIIATLPADLRHEVLLTSSESVISALPSPMIAEAQMLRDRVMSTYQARSLLVNNHRLNNQRNGSGFDRQMAINRGIGVTVGHKASSTIAESLRVREIDGEALLDTNALKALLRLLRLAQPLAKGLLQRLLLNLCAHTSTRGVLVYLLLDMIKLETEGPVGRLTRINSQRLYGCRYNVVYGRSQLVDGLPPLVLTRILEVLTYLATNHSRVADNLFYFDSSHVLKNNKGKEKVIEAEEMPPPAGLSMECDVPILLFTKLLNHRNIAHLEQVLGLFQVIVHKAASKLDCHSHTQHAVTSSQNLPSDEVTAYAQRDPSLAGQQSSSDSKNFSDGLSTSTDQKNVKMYDIFIKLPQTDLHHLCTLLGHEGLSDKVYTLTGEILKKLASIAPMHRNFFIVELSDLALSLSSSAIHELGTLRNTLMLGHSTGSMAGASVLRTLQTLNSLTALGNTETKDVESDRDQVHATIWKLNVSLEPLWQELSECISVIESHLGQGSLSSSLVNVYVGNPPLPPETQRLMPFIEALLVLYEKLQANNSHIQEDNVCATASEVKQLSKSVSSVQATDGAVTFTRFAEKHRRLLNAFVRQDPTLLEKSLSMLLKAPRLLDFDNKRAYFRSRISHQNEQHLAGSLRISVRRAYLLEDSYHQLRMRPLQDMKGRLNVRFQGEEGIDAGGLTREWYQLLSRVIFDKGALLFTTGGNNATFQPNPNSVYQTEHLSYFKFVGRVVAKALFDGQLLDVYFTRSFYKHILGVKVTYHDIEAVDPDYYKNLKWMLENDVSDIPDLTFSMDADEEKHILYEKTQVTDYELKPGGGNIRVTEETKHEYVDLVADHILTNAIRPQINSFLAGFSELIPRELISVFNDKELELLISGLPEIDLKDLKANTEYSGYTAASRLITWFWEVVNAFNKEDRARMLQFVTGTSKVPLEGFKALQGISGPQRFQIHKAYGTPERLPSAHTCFNQLDLPEYTSKEQLQERLLLAIHEASEGFGFA